MELLRKLNLEAINAGAYIGFSWKNSKGRNILDSFNPANEKLLASVNCANDKDYEKIIKHSLVAFKEWRVVPAPLRGELIRQIGQELREKKSPLGKLVSLEMGKSLVEGLGEVQEMIDMADFAVGQSRMLYGKTMHSERGAHRMYEQWHPLGIIGIISAFNFPVAVWAWNAFIAAITGNVSIWKPSSKTPLCAIAVHKICAEVLARNKAPNIFSLFIPEDHDIAELIIADARVNLISFTGSTAVGKKVGAKVSSRLGKSILELGGNNAIIIDESANLDLALRTVLFGALGTAGQRCTSTRRLFIHQNLYKEVVKKLTHAYKQVKIGDPLKSSTHLGPLIDKNALIAYEKLLIEIKNANGRILVGGEKLKGRGYYVLPTLVENVAHDSNIVQRENFLPILFLFSFNEIKEAIDLNNSVNQGLSSAIFTQSLKNSELFLSAKGSDCGIANVNLGTSGAEIGGAFGGEKDTGGGRESGSDVWKYYMRRQTNTINWGDNLPLAQGIKFDII